MAGQNGTILARFPDAGDSAGKKIPLTSDWHRLVTNGGGFFRSSGPFDGGAQFVAVRPVGEYPLVVNVGSTEAAALKTWRVRTLEIAIGGSIALLCFASLIFALAKQFSRLQQDGRRFEAAVGSMSQGLVMYDSRGRLVICNERWRNMYKLGPDQLKAGASVADVKKAMAANGFYWGGDAKTFIDKRLVPGEGQVVEMSDGRAMSIIRNETGDGGWLVTHADITERMKAISRLAHMALHDSLTNLGNRNRFRQCLVDGLERANDTGSLTAILYMDLDRFKDVNDTLGHPVGDQLLRAVADRLRGCARPSDTIARLGEDEFAVIVDGVKSRAEVAAIAQRMLDAIASPLCFEDHRIQVSTSIGIAVAPFDGSGPDSLLKHADLALYHAKSAGRGTYSFFEQSMSEGAKLRHQLEMELRRAGENGEFELYYQPIIDLVDNRIKCFEALLRWHHPTRGLISPAEFIPVAEEMGLIVEIGEWVLKQACAEATRWPTEVNIAVNVSSIQVESGGIVRCVAVALESAGLEPHRLELELTESVLLNNTAANTAVLRQLRDLGVQSSMDDFGTGYSSLGYLRQFPFGTVKIDRSFVREVCEPGGGRTIVKAIIDICNSLGIATVAEGIERPDQLKALRELGCTAGQGFLFSRSKPAAELHELLQAFNGIKKVA